MYNAQSENDLVDCPYDKTHRIVRKRLQNHILRCRKLHPEAELQKCPFNAVHLIPEPEYLHHVSICPDRKLVTQYIYNTSEKPVEHEVIRHEKIEDEENWDDLDIEAPDFKPTVILSRRVKRERLEFLRPIKRPRSRSRSPVRRYPPEKEYIEPKREYIESNEDCFNYQRELDSHPRYSKSQSSYLSSFYREDSSGGTSSKSNYTSHANSLRSLKKEPVQVVEFYDLDDDPYYNGGC